jgi:transaldolase
MAGYGIDVDALAERLQRHGASAFSADWASLLEAIGEKAAHISGATAPTG